MKERTLGAQQHQDLPFEQVVEVVQPARSLAHSAAVPGDVRVAERAAGDAGAAGAGAGQAVKWGDEQHVAKFDLTLSLREAGERIVGGLEYATALFDAATIERYVGYLPAVAGGDGGGAARQAGRAAAAAGSGGARSGCWTSGTRRRRSIRAEQCVHELFEEQVERTPEAVAVVFEEQQLTYGELNARANRLAHYLRELGVGPDERVAICVERGLEMVVGAAGDPEGGRSVRAAGSGLSGGAAAATCWRTRAGGAADARRICERLFWGMTRGAGGGGSEDGGRCWAGACRAQSGARAALG